LAVSLTISGLLLTTETASAAVPGTARLAVSDGPVWTANSVKAKFATGVQTVLLVKNSYPDAVALATPLAAKLNAPLLIVDGGGGTQDTATLDALDYLKPSKGLLIGPDWSPKFPIYGAVASKVANLETVNGPGRIGLSEAVAQKFPDSSSDAFVASGVDASDIATASSAASALRVPLVLTETAYNSFTQGPVNQLTRLGIKRTYQVGALPAADSEVLSKALSAAKIETSQTSGTTAEDRNAEIASVLEIKNIDTSKIYVGSTSYPQEAIAATAEVARDGAFIRLAPKADAIPPSLANVVSAWGPEVEKIALLGDTSRISSAFDTNLRAQIKQRTGKAEFSISSFKTTAGVVSVELTAKANATSYEVFDLGGTLVASSATPSFNLPPLISTVTILAKNGTQTIAQRDIRVSEGNDKAGTTDRVATSAYKGQVTLSWSEAASASIRPRQILRSEVSRASDGSLQQGSAKLIGITCAKEYTDSSPTTSVQNMYTIVPIGEPSNNACGTAVAPPSSREGLESTALSVPTQLPDATVPAMAGLAVESAAGEPRATPTLAERALMSSAGTGAVSEGAGTLTAQQTVLPWVFRHRMFIRDPLVRVMFWHGQTMYGDGRGFSAWAGTHRTQVDTTFTFDSQWRATGATASKNVGQSIEYNCPNILNFSNCTETGRRTASSAGISTYFQPRVAGVSNWPYARVVHSVADPFPVRAFSFPGFDFMPPPIDYIESYNYFINGFTITGASDCAPDHEIWGGYVPGEFIPIMTVGSGDLGSCALGAGRFSYTIKV